MTPVADLLLGLNADFRSFRTYDGRLTLCDGEVSDGEWISGETVENRR